MYILQTVANLGMSGVSVAVADIIGELGYAGSSSLTPTLQIMQRNGYIEIVGGKERGKRRLITLTQRGKRATGTGGLRILGSIPAGPLKEILDQCETIVNAQELLPYQPGDFLLVVEGDSMIGDGILSGDKVLLRPDVQVQNGEIAAVYVGSECQATLKHVHFLPDQHLVVLRASNPNYPDATLNQSDVRVVGVCRGVIREL